MVSDTTLTLRPESEESFPILILDEGDIEMIPMLLVWR